VEAVAGVAFVVVVVAVENAVGILVVAAVVADYTSAAVPLFCRTTATVFVAVAGAALAVENMPASVVALSFVVRVELVDRWVQL